MAAATAREINRSNTPMKLVTETLDETREQANHKKLQLEAIRKTKSRILFVLSICIENGVAITHQASLSWL